MPEMGGGVSGASLEPVGPLWARGLKLGGKVGGMGPHHPWKYLQKNPPPSHISKQKSGKMDFPLRANSIFSHRPLTH